MYPAALLLRHLHLRPLWERQHLLRGEGQEEEPWPGPPRMFLSVKDRG